MIFDLLCSFLMLASGIVANRYLLAGAYMSPGLLVGVRMTVSGILLVLYSSARSVRMNWNYIRHDWKELVIIAFLATLLPAYLKALALSAMPAAKQTLLGSIDPFITALYAYFLWGERLTLRKFLGICIGFTGIAIAVIAHAPGEIVLSEWMYISWPELASFASVSLSRYGWILVQRIMHQGRYEPHEITSLSMILAGIVMLISTCVTTGISGSSLFLGGVLEGEQQWRVLSVLLWSIGIGNILGYSSYSYALKRHSATTVALSGLSMPIFVACIEWVVGLGAPQPYFFYAAGLLIIGFVIFFGPIRYRPFAHIEK